MSISLTPSQTKLSEEIITEIRHPSLLRTNYILSGKPGVGKTILGEYLASHENGIYISFTSDYGREFLSNVDVLDIDGIDFLNFIATDIIGETRDKLFVIDDTEFIFNYIEHNGQLENFLRGYRRYTLFNKILLVVPYICLDKLSGQGVYNLAFLNEDKAFLADHYSIAKSIAMDYKNGYYF